MVQANMPMMGMQLEASEKGIIEETEPLIFVHTY